MKKAVIFGAGNIGRGFIGQLFFESGYQTRFIDVNVDIVLALNERRAYPVRILANESHEDILVENVSALDGCDLPRIADAIAEADLMATAVGANVLPRIAPSVAAGLVKRYERGGAPLDILICENLKDAGEVFRAMLLEELPEPVRAWFEERVGLAETSIGRMVPLQTPELQDGDALRVCVEAYASLPVDEAAFKAGIPAIRGIKPYSPFSFYVERKLYIHNMGHALAAYLGDYYGHTYIWEAVNAPVIREAAHSAMTAGADALAKKYDVGAEELYAHVDDLLLRFANRRLGDTVYRVGRDLKRKLAPGDRMTGALRLCMEQGTRYTDIALGIALALRFSHEPLEITPEQALRDICKINENEPVYALILDMHERAVRDPKKSLIL